jgi:carbon monoxide dehydrogenase subunit G
VIRFEYSIEIDRPPSEVFAYITDTDRVSEWQSGVVEAQWQGEKVQGSRIREVRKLLGRRMESELEVTKYEPERRFDLRSVSGPFPFSVAQVLEPRDGGTRVVLVGEGEPGGFFKLAESIVGRVAQRQLKNDFETLKDILESDRPT